MMLVWDEDPSLAPRMTERSAQDDREGKSDLKKYRPKANSIKFYHFSIIFYCFSINVTIFAYRITINT